MITTAGCGPTAEVIRPTEPAAASSLPTPPTSTQPATDAPSPAVASTPDASGTAETPATPTTPGTAATPTAGSASGALAQPLSAFPAGDAFEVTDVVATPDGYVAVGFGSLDGAGYSGHRQGIVWRSSDGVTWQESRDTALEDVTPRYVAAIAGDVYVAGEYSTCAIDEDCEEDIPSTVVFRSASGGPVELLTVSPDINAAAFDGMTSAGSGLIAFGESGDGTTTFAHSW